MAYADLYHRVTKGITPAGVLKVDAILGLPGAKERYEASRRETATSVAGFEVG